MNIYLRKDYYFQKEEKRVQYWMSKFGSVSCDTNNIVKYKYKYDENVMCQ